MSLYAAQAGLETDTEFVKRVRACIIKETNTWELPTAQINVILAEILPDVASAPGFANKYLYGDSANLITPGQDAISDVEILSATQPLLAPYQPQPS